MNVSKKWILSLMLFIVCFWDLNAKQQCGNYEHNAITFDNCESQLLVKQNGLKISCNLTKNDVFGKWNGTNHDMLISTTFTTSEQINLNNSIDCLKLIRVWITYQLRAKLFEFSQITLYTDHQFAPKSSIGEVNYNGTCIRKVIARAKYFNLNDYNVTRCINSVRTLDFSSNLTSVNYNSSFYKDPQEYVNDVLLTELNENVIGFGIKVLKFSFARLNLALLSNLSVKTLNFSDNGIFKISNADFPLTKTLENLNLENCQLQSVEESAFVAIPNLKRLNLARNNLVQFPYTVSTLRVLQNLNLSSNGGVTFFAHSIFGFEMSPHLAELDRLEVLDLSNMRMFTYTAFHAKMFSLKFVNLAKTKTVIEPDDYSFPTSIGFPNVEVLNLSNCKKDAKRIFNEEYPNLITLDVSDNELVYRPEFDILFNQFPKLKHVNLANNNIDRFLTINLTDDGRSEIFLNLKGNNISTWNQTKIISSATKNLTIDVSKNRISSVNSAMLTDFSNISEIILDENPFDCSDCVVNQFRDWLIDRSITSYKCAYPKNLEGQFISEINIDLELCVEKYFNWLVNILIPISIVLLTIIAIAYLMLRYKWHLRYFYHLFRARIAFNRRNFDANEMNFTFKYDAFVSYCSHDSQWVVRELIPHLEKEEPIVHLCVHERDFEIGGTIINNVIDCIDCSRKSIFLISNTFIRSNWCQWELQMAQHKLFDDGSDVLVLVLLEELIEEEIPKTLKRLMSTRTYLIWPQSDNVPACKLFWARLKQSIGDCHCLQVQQSGL